MMASRKTGAGVSRPRQMSGKKSSTMQFVLIGVGAVVVVVIALLLFGGAKKPAQARAKSKTASAGQGTTGRKAVKKSSAATRSGKVDREAVRAQRREERLKQKQAMRPEGGRTSRSSSGGYRQGGSSRGGSSRSGSADPSQLRAIVTDGAGSRFALVGERRFKTGDDVEGRRILEVSADEVKVEYRQNTYTVKVGQKIY